MGSKEKTKDAINYISKRINISRPDYDRGWKGEYSKEKGFIFRRELRGLRDNIIIDNTNLKKKDRDIYFDLINKKNITFDIFWGFGVRFYNKTTNQYYKLKYEYIDECACDKELIIEDFEERKYNNYYISPTLHLGLNIGYTF